MANRYVGVDSADPRLPDVVIDATMPYFDVRTYGAVGDGSTDDTTEIAAAITDAAAVVGASTLDIEVFVNLARNKHYKVSSLTIPKGVVLVGNGAKIQANTSGTIITLTGFRSGIRDAVIFGVGTSTANLGIHMSSTSSGSRQEVRNVVFDALGGRAILCEAIASVISDVVAQNCLGVTAGLAAETGVLELNTTDVWVTNSEFTASRTSLSSGGFVHAVVVKGGTHTLQGVIGEISDHGFYITGTETRLIGCRADLNYGHGFRFITPSTGSLVGCHALRNSRETTNTYDGFNFADATNWLVDGCRSSSLSADAWKHRYGFYDATNGYGNYNQFGPTNRSTLATTAPIFVEPYAGSKVAGVDGPFLAVPAAATTVDIQQYGWPMCNWVLSSVAAVNFTDFTKDITGIRLTVIGDGQTTFVHDGTKIYLQGGVNLLTVWGRVYQFVSHNGLWYQVT